jgi:hypothetical protein
MSGDVVDFQQVSGNVGRDAARSAGFARFDASLHKAFSIPRRENIKVEVRFDAFNVFNRSNWNSNNTNDVLTAMGLSLATDASGNITGPNPDFFNCTSCQRPNGTFVGSAGQILHLSNLQNGKVSSNLLKPTFALLGDPGADDLNSIGPRKLQLSFHVRF